MRHLIASGRRRAAEPHGFTMIVAMTGMLVVMMLGAAAFAAANGDIRTTGTNSNQKQAYAAAEAAIADYQYHLNQNPDYWRKCDATADLSPVTQRVVTPADQAAREWRTLPGANAEYTIEVLPAEHQTNAPAYTTCSLTKPDQSMIDPTNGTFRIRVTGRMKKDNTIKRSIIATFKRTGFLDFLWYTDLEAQDPVVWSKVNGCAGTPTNDLGTNYPTCFVTGNAAGTQQNLDAWGTAQCSKYYRDGRATVDYPGEFLNKTSPWYTPGSSNNLADNTWYQLDNRPCTEITYGTGEYIKGPFHTNDSILVCDDPIFGRTTADRVEVSATAAQTPVRETCGANNIQMQGTWLPGSPRLDPPPNNASLSKNATLTFTGATKIVFNGDGTMTVTNDYQASKVMTYNESPDEVIFVQAKASCSYDPFKPLVYDGTTTTAAAKDCGDAVIQGQYTENTTIGADNDIVITDDLVQATGKDVLMGLIANNFVRVAHASKFDPSGSAQWHDALYSLMSTSTQRTLHTAPKCTNTNTATKDLKVQAAILALTHQWTVDRYGCGAGLGTLSVTGTMAQKYRGVVGIGGGTTGFIKNYTYDDRLRYRSPPKFLNPVNTAWNVAREIEQSPAT
jgi:type II secretory pathway pseudopilin PulG